MTPENERAARLALLTQRSNPKIEFDYIVALDGTIGDGRCRIRLTYVPDKLLLETDAFAAYLGAFGDDAAARIEALALAILDDIGNEIVPRWVQVVVSRPYGATAAGMQCVIVEDRQPRWDNPRILACLPGALSPGADDDGD